MDEETSNRLERFKNTMVHVELRGGPNDGQIVPLALATIFTLVSIPQILKPSRGQPAGIYFVDLETGDRSSTFIGTFVDFEQTYQIDIPVEETETEHE